MSKLASRWSEWRERAAAAAYETGSLGGAMAELADQVSVARGSSGSLERRWAALGVEIHRIRMLGRGRCESTADGAPVVYLNADSKESAQQFTIAHEIAHALLRSLDPELIIGISTSGEEELCDAFAQRVILPPENLAAALGGGALPSLRHLLVLCGRFHTGPSVVLRALPQHLNLDHTAYLLARRRAHFHRPGVAGFRLDLVAGPPGLFWPYETRVENLGLESLVAATRRATHGEFFDGADAELRVKLARVERDTGYNALAGPARWHAVRQGLNNQPYLLARVDCSLLQPVRLERGPRTSDVASDAVPLASR